MKAGSLKHKIHPIIQLWLFIHLITALFCIGCSKTNKRSEYILGSWTIDYTGRKNLQFDTTTSVKAIISFYKDGTGKWEMIKPQGKTSVRKYNYRLIIEGQKLVVTEGKRKPDTIQIMKLDKNVMKWYAPKSIPIVFKRIAKAA